MSLSARLQKRSVSRHRQTGSATSFIFGTVFGLAIALGVTWYLNWTELPLSGITTQAGIPDLSPGPGQSPPDPNSSV
ncbi:MAG: hypothetical protein R3194_09390, partial [Limnobacter sp.]|nr:hypothetical protein [Limnobacter sp.]